MDHIRYILIMSKLSYINTIKKLDLNIFSNINILENINTMQIYKPKKIYSTNSPKFNQKNKINIADRIQILIQKICKNFNPVFYKIKKQIFKHYLNQQTLSTTMNNINDIIIKSNIYKLVELSSTNPNHNWVSVNLINIIKNNIIQKNMSNIKIVDIGGGEGYVLSNIGQALNINKQNLLCIESSNEWYEEYNLINNSMINYVIWDNVNLPIVSNSVDVFILMVSMHHMSDEIINNLLKNIKNIIKPSGIIIIKEHDCVSIDDKFIIDWEHHLYHLMMTNDLNKKKINKYTKNFVSNYKSKIRFDELFLANNFGSVVELNRFFKYDNTNTDIKNVSKLYWKIYKPLLKSDHELKTFMV